MKQGKELCEGCEGKIVNYSLSAKNFSPIDKLYDFAFTAFTHLVTGRRPKYVQLNLFSV
jgi:hypothetical protein